MAKKVGKFIYWTPRILGIVFILFLSLFSLDIFESATTFGEIALGLFIHNTPSLILLVVLIISWKHELVGAVVFILAGALYIIFSTIGTWPKWYLALSWSLIIAGPAFFIGILFYLNWKKKQKKYKRKISS